MAAQTLAIRSGQDMRHPAWIDTTQATESAGTLRTSTKPRPAARSPASDHAGTGVLAPPAQRSRVRLVFAAAVFLSAFLLFQVQPLISKAILPWFGGAPSVWTTCMLVFQSLLFAGYAYAHLCATRLRPRAQLVVHLALLFAAVALLPILPGHDAKPAAGESPVGHIVLVLLGSLGLPFFALSTTGPLLQSWFHRVSGGNSPYRLYALSNAGSLAALLTYPLLVEPFLPLPAQSAIWSTLFVLFTVLVGACGVAAWRTAAGNPLSAMAERPRIDDIPPAPAVGKQHYLLWFALGMAPSVMLLAVTNQICLDVASVPFLWVLPLALYLLSFILTFDNARWYARRVYPLAYGLSAAAMVFVLSGGAAASIPLQVCVFLSGLFTASMVCHGELARLKPPPAQLTSFYLVLAAAGAAGGLFVGVLAPLLFNSFLELHLAIVGTLVLMLYVLGRDPAGSPFPVTHAWARRAAWLGALVIAAGLGYCVVQEHRDDIAASRDFYGVLHVKRTELSGPDDALVKLVHGRIIHGAQFTGPGRRNQPTLYYGRQSGVGIALQHHHAERPRRVGLVGLGAGVLAVYGRPGDTYCFYEINPSVARLAQEHFTFLRDSAAKCEIVLGDARLTMEAELEQGTRRKFDVLALDAFSSDSIPTHLLTLEAMRVYLEHLASDGLLAVHLSNQHFDLVPVLAAASRALNLSSRVVTAKGDLTGAPSLWVLLSPSGTALSAPGFRGLLPLDGGRTLAWTDDHCSLLNVMRPVTSEKLFFVATGSEALDEHITRGISLLETNRLEDAEREFRAALAIDETSAGAWLHLGNALHRAGRRNEARDCFQRAVELDPSSSEAHNNLGGLLASNDPQRAAQHLRAALQLDPRNAQARSNLANVLARQGQFAQAIDQYEQALQIDPDLSAARQNLEIVRQWLQEAGPGGPQRPRP